MGRGLTQDPRGFIGPMLYFGYAGATPDGVRRGAGWRAGVRCGGVRGGGGEAESGQVVVAQLRMVWFLPLL